MKIPAILQKNRSRKAHRYYNIASKKVIEMISLEFIRAAYRGLHDLDLDLAVRKAGEQIDKKKNNMFS